MEKIEFEIKPVSKFSIGLKELWEHRELLYFFTWRDIKVKYKQTVLGVLWVVLQPLILMVVFTVFLGSKMKQDLGQVDYSLFVLSGFLCWNIFSSAINNAGNSMVSNASIIKKIYFPRLIIPVASVLSAFVDFIVGIIFYAIALIYYRPAIDFTNLIFMPISLILVFFAALGSGTMISALSVKYRDFRYILPFFVQALLFVSPVLWTQNKNSQLVQTIFAFNPMYAPLELFRSHLQGYETNQKLILVSLFSNVLLLIIGVFVFRKTERYFADLT
jgi:lipopolysaccharide transport system permease protein